MYENIYETLCFSYKIGITLEIPAIGIWKSPSSMLQYHGIGTVDGRL
jgi:hypothetical protein